MKGTRARATTACGSVRRVFRPAADHSPGFDLAYVRSGPRTDTPIVVIPGGPGLASMRPYRALRRLAAAGGLDVIMVEHRGIGASRRDTTGEPLTHDHMRITAVVDDIAAVLDHERVERAVIAGSSYGSYLASSFGARHPERVAGMLLDSALQSTGALELERLLIRQLFWNAETPIASATRALSERGLDERLLLDVVRAAYELAGAPLLEPLLANRLRRSFGPAWKALEVYAQRDESIARIPGHYEFDIAGAIGFRELNYGAELDGLPLDPARTYAPIAHRFPAFEHEPFDLAAEAAKFDWPMVLLAGSRDVRTPPEIAARVAKIVPGSVLVQIENGHSTLDTHPVAFLNAVRLLVQGRTAALPDLAARLDALPRRGLSARFARALKAAVRSESRLLN